MLKLTNVSSSYDKTKVCKDISVEINQGDFVSILGANGAGKTTLLCTIMGMVQKNGGRIMFEGEDITNLTTHEICKRGLMIVAGMNSLFAPMSVWENLMVSLYPFQKGLSKAEINRRFELVYGIFPILFQRKEQQAGTLSGGERQMLSIAKTLINNPRLLMLDEPSLGLAPIVIENLFETIVQIKKEQGLTVLMVEQNIDIALKISNRGYVLDVGSIVMEDTAENLLNDPKVKEVYLGMVQ